MLITLCQVLLSAAPVVPAVDPAISTDLLLSHVRFLASDALEGRGPATSADRVTQQYISTQFEILGLKPFGDSGTWLQKFDLVGVDGAPQKLSFEAGKSKLELKLRDDFIAVSGHQEPVSKLEAAELVFVGYGIVAPEYGWNDFKDVDVKGKVIVVMNNDPEDDPALFAGKARLWYGRWDYKYEQAAKVGAAGCIIIHTTPSAGYPWQVVQTSWSGEQFDLPLGAGPKLQVKAWTTEDAMRKVMALTGKDLDQLRAAAQKKDFVPVPLGVKVSTQFTNTVARKTTANVLGVLNGSDPKLAGEFVVITAHHDHLGIKEHGTLGEDIIYNGAVDNASGVAALLVVAKAMTAQPKPPKRSVLFAAVAAEEQGLLGSQFLVEHAPVSPAKMQININIDGINIWGRTSDVSVIGMGKSSVDGLIETLAKQQKRVMKGDALADRGFFYRSDQFNFAKVGVPAAYFGSGEAFVGQSEAWGKSRRSEYEAKNYHQPSDELTAEWNVSGAAEDVTLYYRLALTVANAAQGPVWNKGDEFEAVRLKSLEKR